MDPDPDPEPEPEPEPELRGLPGLMMLYRAPRLRGSVSPMEDSQTAQRGMLVPQRGQRVPSLGKGWVRDEDLGSEVGVVLAFLELGLRLWVVLFWGVFGVWGMGVVVVVGSG